MLAPLMTSLRALLVALASVLLAYGYFADGSWRPVIVCAALLPIGAGLILEFIGRSLLKRTNPNPQVGVRLMGWWVLVPSALAALASAVMIIVTVELAAPTGASDQTKELLGALSAGITAFLTTMWIDPSGEVDDAVAGRVQQACFNAFSSKSSANGSRLTQVLNDTEFVDPATDENVNVGLVSDWKRAGRAKRAKVIEAELSSPATV